MIEGLNPSDPGVQLLARAVADVDPTRVLLVYCAVPGLGPGATRLVLDVREQVAAGTRALRARVDASWREEAWSVAVVWPRAHLGKDFSLACLAHGAMMLRSGGRLLCAARKQKGGRSLARWMARLLGDVEIVARDRGYALYESRKAGPVDLDVARALTDVRYTVEDAALAGLRLESVPGVFCRRHLDRGTKRLIEQLERAPLAAPARVLDLCAGIGPLALWAAGRWPAARVLAVESNLLAAELVAHNAEANGHAARVEVRCADGLGRDAPAERYELALCNPPTHADPTALRTLLEPLPRWLRAGAPAWLVVNRTATLRAALPGAPQVTTVAADGYTLVEARWRESP